MLSSTAANTTSNSSSHSRTSSRSRRCMRVGTLTAVLLGIALLALSTVVHDHNHAARMGSSSSQTGRKPLVSILTVTYNRQQFLPKVFRLMEQQGAPGCVCLLRRIPSNRYDPPTHSPTHKPRVNNHLSPHTQTTTTLRLLWLTTATGA